METVSDLYRATEEALFRDIFFNKTDEGKLRAFREFEERRDAINKVVNMCERLQNHK